jgi:hypothetical protein
MRPQKNVQFCQKIKGKKGLFAGERALTLALWEIIFA